MGTFTYNSSQASTNDAMFIRLRLGDTSSDDPLLYDEEIAAFLSLEGNRYLAAAVAAESIAAKFSRRSDKHVGKLWVMQSQQAKAYLELAKTLRGEIGLHVAPFAGGISVDDKISTEQDTDRVNPGFTVDQFDNPGLPSNGARDW